MSVECSICLNILSEPVSIPCGHVYCMKCLSEHVNAAENDHLSSTCPTCRHEFSIVTPDLTYLPKKYHRYVLPGVRRIYIDTRSVAELQKKASQAEKKNKRLTRENEELMQQCERQIHRVAVYAEKEAEALEQVEELRTEIEGLRLEYENEADTRIELQYKVDNYQKQYAEMHEQLLASQRRIQELERQASSRSNSSRSQSLRRSASVISHNGDNPGLTGVEEAPEEGSDPYPIPARRRVVRPLPLRTKVSQHLNDACDAADSQIAKGNARHVKRPRLSAPS